MMVRGEKLVTAVVAATVLVSSGTAGAAPLQALGRGEGAVYIVAWPGYIERGETRPTIGSPASSSAPAARSA